MTAAAEEEEREAESSVRKRRDPTSLPAYLQQERRGLERLRPRLIESGKSPLIAPLAASHATQRKPLAMKRNLLLLLLLFVSGVLVQTAAAAAPVADAEALENEEEHDEHDEDEVAEAREEFESIDKNGDGFLERDEIMAMEEVRT